MTSKIYRDADGNECSLLELCRKAPEWAAHVIETLEARWEKYTDPGVVHPLRAPERVWVQWMPRLRGAMVYLRPPAILDGTIGNYVLTNTVGHGGEVRLDGSRVCLDCGIKRLRAIAECLPGPANRKHQCRRCRHAHSSRKNRHS